MLPLQGGLAVALALAAAGGVCTALGPGLGLSARQSPGVSAPWPLSVVAALPGLAARQAPAAPAGDIGHKTGRQACSRAPAALPCPAAAAAPAPDAADPSGGDGQRAPCTAPHAARNSGSRHRAPGGLPAGASPGVLGSTFSSAPLPGLAQPQAPVPAIDAGLAGSASEPGVPQEPALRRCEGAGSASTPSSHTGTGLGDHGA